MLVWSTVVYWAAARDLMIFGQLIEEWKSENKDPNKRYYVCLDEKRGARVQSNT